MKYKIIEFISRLNDGGAETLVKDYALTLDKKKFEVNIVVIRPIEDTANFRILKENNIKIIPIYPRWNVILKVCNKLFGRYLVAHRLKKILKSEKADVLHVHMSLLHYLSPISSSLKDMKLFYTCHSEPRWFFTGNNAREAKAAKSLIKNNGLRLIALHDDMAKELNEMFGVNNTVVIKNCIDFLRFRSVKETKEEIRASLNIPENAFVVGHVGRFSCVKNHDFLVEVFNTLNNMRGGGVYICLWWAPATGRNLLQKNSGNTVLQINF